jgi:hypothetical protein
MLNEKKISAVVDAATKQALIAQIENAKTALSFMVNLTYAERKRLFKMGPKSVAYVEECLRVARANPQILPTGFDLNEFGSDLQLVIDLRDIFVVLEPFYEAMQDTIYAAGSDAMLTANRVYAYAKVAAKNDSTLKASVDELGRRYKYAKTKKATEEKENKTE